MLVTCRVLPPFYLDININIQNQVPQLLQYSQNSFNYKRDKLEYFSRLITCAINLDSKLCSDVIFWNLYGRIIDNNT